MTKRRGYADEDLREVADNPEWTDEELAKAKPLEVVLPQLAAALREDREHRAAHEQQRVTLDLDREVVERYKAAGADWRARMSEALTKAAAGL